MIDAPKVRLDSNETARLATTTRALPIPEYGPSVSNQTLLMFRKTVHTGTTIVEVVATYEHTGAGLVSVRSLCFSFLCEKVCEYFGRVVWELCTLGSISMPTGCGGVIARERVPHEGHVTLILYTTGVDLAARNRF